MRQQRALQERALQEHFSCEPCRPAPQCGAQLVFATSVFIRFINAARMAATLDAVNVAPNLSTCLHMRSCPRHRLLGGRRAEVLRAFRDPLERAVGAAMAFRMSN